MIGQGVFNSEEINVLWRVKLGAHPAIVSNIHDLIADIAWELGQDQINYMFELILDTWIEPGCSTKDREGLLQLVGRLAKGSLTDKAIDLLWAMGSRRDIIPDDIMSETLSTIVNILKQQDQQDKMSDKIKYNVNRKANLMRKLVIQLRAEPQLPTAIPIMQLFEFVGNLFEEKVGHASSTLESLHAQHSNYGDGGDEVEDVPDRKTMINRLQVEYDLILLVRTELIEILTKFHGRNQVPPRAEICARLNFIRYLLREGQTFLDYDHSKEIWNGLIIGGIHPSEPEIGFEWFTSLMGDDADLARDSIYRFFIENILQYNTAKLNQGVILCFSSFFGHIHENSSLDQEERDNPIQLGLNYMWKALTSCEESVAPQIINIIQTTYLNKHHHSINANHNDFFDECNQRLKPFKETLSVISTTEGSQEQGQRTAVKIRRVLDVLRHYVANWPWLRGSDDAVPLDQAWRGKPKNYRVQATGVYFSKGHYKRKFCKFFST